ncbi:MAG: His/Gly/Thr/Pro-type tRNA ligase C-terminal domain-containing protein, partial [Thermoplasmata archaeon]
LQYLQDIRPEWDKFPGAVYTVAFDTAMPSNRSLQIGTIHEYGTNFAKNYDIKYLKDDGTYEYANQTTFGMSERLLAAVIGIHGDDTGLILPPEIAPYQIVIVPIPGEGVNDYSEKVNDILKDHGFRTKLDSRENYTPGYKFNDWEMRGVPVRIEIGSREASKKTITIALRNIKGKEIVSLSEAVQKIDEAMKRVKEKIVEDAQKDFEKRIFIADNADDLKAPEGLGIAFWCGSKECSDAIEQKYDRTALGFMNNDDRIGKCVICGKEGKMGVFGRSY